MRLSNHLVCGSKFICFSHQPPFWQLPVSRLWWSISPPCKSWASANHLYDLSQNDLDLDTFCHDVICADIERLKQTPCTNVFLGSHHGGTVNIDDGVTWWKEFLPVLIDELSWPSMISPSFGLLNISDRVGVVCVVNSFTHSICRELLLQFRLSFSSFLSFPWWWSCAYSSPILLQLSSVITLFVNPWSISCFTLIHI